MKKLLAFVLCVLLLAGCTAPVVETPTPPEPEYIGNSPVPNIRSGIYSSGMGGYGNSMEVTDNGVYFMCDAGGGRSYLLYCDYGSDTFVKLCARPDCTHSDRFCNAFFENGCNVYYDGTYLYVGEVSGTIMNVYRLDLNGENRTQFMDTSAVRAGFNRGGSMRSISNGYCFFTLGKMVGGDIEYTCFYYKLDGSMDQPEQLPSGFKNSYDDGKNILLIGPGKYDDRPESGRYLWDPNTNTPHWIVDQQEWFYGYVSVNGIYYIDNGVIYHKSAGGDNIEKLFDTGLKGEHELKAFPEYFVIIDRVHWWKEGRENAALKGQTLRFYNWDFEFLGQAEIDYMVGGSYVYEDIITGETKDRIYLAAYDTGLPQYYIDKSAFGRKIKIHPLELPEDIEEFYREQYEESHLEPWEE